MRAFLLLFLATVIALPARAQLTAADSSGIRAAALDYAAGWYTGDADRVERALHPALARRIVLETDSVSMLQEMDFDTLAGAARDSLGTRTPSDERRADVQILDAFGNAAAVRLDMRHWVEFLQMARWNGAWKIVNVLWYPRP